MSFSPRGHFDQELLKLQNSIVQLSSIVETMTDEALRATEGNNLELARHVILEDREVNNLRHEVEQNAALLLATQSPTATDLRKVLTAIHISTELERMGDHARGIAVLVERLLQEEKQFDALHSLPKMARRARKMLYKAIEAYLKQDLLLARDVMSRDRKVNRGYYKLFSAVLSRMTDPNYLKQGTYLLWIGHNFERIADRAVNVAERVVYLVTGRFEESSDMSMDWEVLPGDEGEEDDSAE